MREKGKLRVCCVDEKEREGAGNICTPDGTVPIWWCRRLQSFSTLVEREALLQSQQTFANEVTVRSHEDSVHHKTHTAAELHMFMSYNDRTGTFGLCTGIQQTDEQIVVFMQHFMNTAISTRCT